MDGRMGRRGDQRRRRSGRRGKLKIGGGREGGGGGGGGGGRGGGGRKRWGRVSQRDTNSPLAIPVIHKYTRKMEGKVNLHDCKEGKK